MADRGTLSAHNRVRAKVIKAFTIDEKKLVKRKKDGKETSTGTTCLVGSKWRLLLTGEERAYKSIYTWR